MIKRPERGMFMGGRIRMRGTGAAKRQEPEPPPAWPPDGAALAGKAHKAYDEQAEVHARIREVCGEVQAAARHAMALPATCGNAREIAGSLRLIAEMERGLLGELILTGAHGEEARAAAAACAQALALSMPAYELAIAEGRRQRDAELAAEQAARAPGSHRKGRHLKVAPAAAVRGAAAAAVVAAATTGVIAAHDSASVHHWAASAPRPAASLAHQDRPDSAVLIPQAPVSPSPRPSMAAASVSPAPTASPSAPASLPPPPVPSPSATGPAAPDPSLLVSVRDLQLTGPSGTFTLTAVDGPVEWSITTTIPGGSVDVQQGVLTPAQEPVTVKVTVPPGSKPGVIYIRWGTRDVATIHVFPAAS